MLVGLNLALLKDNWCGDPQLFSFYVPPTKRKGGHIGFGADPVGVGVSVGVHVASFPCVIF